MLCILGKLPTLSDLINEMSKTIVNILGGCKMKMSAMDWSLCPPHINLLVPYPQCDGIWRGSLWEVIRIRGGHGGGALDKMGLIIIKKEEQTTPVSLPFM